MQKVTKNTVLILFPLLVGFATPSSPTMLHVSASGVSPVNCSTGNANQQAACLTAANNKACSAAFLGDYYVEIGNASGVLFSYQNGGSINRYSLEQMDSFTKFVDAAYWVQKRGGVNSLTADDVLHLHQQSGDVNMPSSCPAGSTVLQCAATAPGVNSILSLGTITNGGSDYTVGSNKTNLEGGTGTGATATLTVNGSGVVTGVALLAAGSGYTVGDVLTSVLGGGSGLAIPVANTTCYPATGYTIGSTTIASNAYAATCTNDKYTFYYNGAQFQSHGIIDGTSAFYNLTRTGLANEVNTTLGTATITASTNSGSATFNNTGNNGLVAGMHVYLSGNIPSGFSGFLGAYQVYYVTNVNAAPTGTTFQLSTAGCNPNCGAAVTALSTTSGVTVTVMPVTYSMTLLAGGANWSAGGIAAFMQNILSGTLLFQGALGTYEVTPNFLGNGEPTGGTDGTYCAYSTYPAQVLHGTVFGSPTAATTVTCGTGGTTLTAIGASGSPSPWINQGLSQAIYSPISANYKYGVGHWVISDPVVNGDGAYAGIGSKGVDGWIDATTNTYYGVLVRVGPGGSGYKSNVCDNLIRHAYVTGVQQTGTYPSP